MAKTKEGVMNEPTSETPAAVPPPVAPAPPAGQQEYLVLCQIGGAGDPEIWKPGSRIWLDDLRAALHLAAGNVAPLGATQPPQPPQPTAIVHTAG